MDMTSRPPLSFPRLSSKAKNTNSSIKSPIRTIMGLVTSGYGVSFDVFLSPPYVILSSLVKSYLAGSAPSVPCKNINAAQTGQAFQPSIENPGEVRHHTYAFWALFLVSPTPSYPVAVL